MIIYSWNVNGIRAIYKKGFVDWMHSNNADIICLQETKAQYEQLEQKIITINPYYSYFASAEKKGYSGVAIYSRIKPLNIEYHNDERFDSEGRTIIAEYADFILINCYFPNSQEGGKRLHYKLDFCTSILDKCNEYVKNHKNIIICGDYNIAHQEIDLARPADNHKSPGFLPAERAFMTHFLNAGYVDIFRHFHPHATEQYSWWSYRAQARQRNIGWRIDYHCINEAFLSHVTDARIHPHILGSDHCPVSITLQ